MLLKRIIKIFFNYYLVLKSLWFILLFLILGFFAFYMFGQGQDILSGLELFTEKGVSNEALLILALTFFWAWQTWRASRVKLHFSYFNFWSYQPGYAYRAQVLIPRILGFLPFLIMGFSISQAQDSFGAIFWLFISSGLWFFIFLWYRRDIIVWYRSKFWMSKWIIPGYIPIKNGIYPVRYIWQKQKVWIWIRGLFVVNVFFLVYIFPIEVPQVVGSVSVVLAGISCWLIISSLLNLVESYVRFPLSFTTLLLALGIGFLPPYPTETLKSSAWEDRLELEEHFEQWLDRNEIFLRDNPEINLVMAEGGGIRSAYWTNAVLKKLETKGDYFKERTYAYSSVSGGTLGVAVYHRPMNNSDSSLKEQFLSKDFLAPLTARLIFHDVLQKFIPFRLTPMDRSQTLEEAWIHEEKKIFGSGTWENPFLQVASKEHLVLFNSTHVESGKRAVISNADLSQMAPDRIIDLLKSTQSDVSYAQAIGFSSRFPFLTSPAYLEKNKGEIWGSVVDGGYYENLGASTLFQIAKVLRKVIQKKGLNYTLNFIAIRNTQRLQNTPVNRPFFEVSSPILTLGKIWAGNGEAFVNNQKQTLKTNNDRLQVIRLDRTDTEAVPLGWYLTAKSKAYMDAQKRSLNLFPE
jgi:hypothetical protein